MTRSTKGNAASNYAHAFGKSVVEAIYPVDSNAHYGYAEVAYRWGLATQSPK